MSSTRLYALVADPEVIYSNGLQLGCENLAVLQPCGDTVYILPPLQHIFDLGVTANGVAMMASPRGQIAGYLLNGVPEASLWLNTTAGTYAPVGTPVVAGDMVYIATRRLGSADCRLAAVEVRRTLNDKFVLHWLQPYACPASAGSAPPMLFDMDQQLWLPTGANLTVMAPSLDHGARVVASFPTGPVSAMALGPSGRVMAATATSLVVLNASRVLATLPCAALVGAPACRLHAGALVQAFGGAGNSSVVAVVDLNSTAVVLVGIDADRPLPWSAAWTLPLPGATAESTVGQLVAMNNNTLLASIDGHLALFAAEHPEEMTRQQQAGRRME